MSSTMSWLLGASAAILIGYGSYRYIKHRIGEYVLAKVAEKINSVVATANEEDFFRPIHKNSAVITFTSGGQKYRVFVPYNRKMSTRYLGKKVYLEKGDELIDITQKPGVPYTVAASDLGGEWIVVKDRDGKTIKRFSSQEIPNML